MALKTSLFTCTQFSSNLNKNNTTSSLVLKKPVSDKFWAPDTSLGWMFSEIVIVYQQKQIAWWSQQVHGWQLKYLLTSVLWLPVNSMASYSSVQTACNRVNCVFKGCSEQKSKCCSHKCLSAPTNCVSGLHSKTAHLERAASCRVWDKAVSLLRKSSTFGKEPCFLSRN